MCQLIFIYFENSIKLSAADTNNVLLSETLRPFSFCLVSFSGDEQICCLFESDYMILGYRRDVTGVTAETHIHISLSSNPCEAGLNSH